MSLTRRAALGGGLAASTIVLAGCSETSAPAETASDAVPTGEIKLGLAGDVAIGSGTKFAVSKMLTVLVTQPKAGTYKAFDATCTHAGCIVSGVENSEIFCGCHGARFDSETGMVLTGPARNALGKLNLELRGEELWVVI